MTTRLRASRPRQSAAVTRKAIHDAAHELFRNEGFDAVGIRAVAARAGVDAALVIRHFGSKERLFLEAMTVDLPAIKVMEGPLEGMGRAIVEHVVCLPSSRPGALAVTALAALFRASDREEVQRNLRETIENVFAEPLVRRLEGGDAELRAHLIAAQLGGLLTSMHVVQDPVLLAADRSAIVVRYGDSIQQLIGT
ncbi:TetR/AcrR family transcriptional regulator [Streptosporangium roseum]|uniref:Transcriptional regulator, TetR family n=1 Tax=Streptosporangium roseum (strain ATCC 12428 / DSM 43021 / JCM 3005 / KCTC 9067 / NCIMB 10171 / NRRL 2505 / NI 9100) TaxID=479432 RepID=D2AQL1_STRRD|nr:TetR/AcrR family transcriptional regulator [Streptosporangium roseum]ACZ84555.1 putative transcriptional regulator, TetR family [Streptosporangium roseum DSM 43021]